MQLLIQRGQRHGKVVGSPVFHLWAKFELMPDEEALIQKYGLKKFALVEGNPTRDLLLAARTAVVFAILAFVVVMSAVGIMGLGLAIQSGFLIFIISTIVVYQQIKERILVSDILSGKRFTCKSVVTLMAKEKMLTELAQGFRSFLEAAKTWGGREVFDIEAGGEVRPRLIEQAHGTA